MTVIRLKKEYFSLFAVGICIFLLFRYPESIRSGVMEGLSICFYTIIPSLFPFMALVNYITRSNILSFKRVPITIPTFIISMVGGFPIGIKMVNDLFLRGQISKKQAYKMCLFCMNGGPAFVITAVGMNMLGSQKAGVIIYLSIVISSLIFAGFSMFFGGENEKNENVKAEIPKPIFSISASISDALQGILGICGHIAIFSSITSCINGFPLNENVKLVINSLLEVTKGCVLLSPKMNLSLLAFLIGFGGICVHFQVLSYLKKVGMKYYIFLLSRIGCGVLSGGICYLLLQIFPVEIDVFGGENKVFATSFSISAPAFFVFIFMCIIMIFDIDRKRKVC